MYANGQQSKIYCCCDRFGWLNMLSWLATLSGIAALITGAIYASKTGMSSGYSDANCTIPRSGGYTTKSFCEGRNCDSSKVCCEFNVMVTPLNGAPPFNKPMKMRFCKWDSPLCEKLYWQLRESKGSIFYPDYISFLCLYKQDLVNNEWLAMQRCVDDIGSCDLVTLEEHTRLIEYDNSLARLLPLWIVLIVLGVLGLPFLPMRIAKVGRDNVGMFIEPKRTSNSDSSVAE
jgi:hypothetical protein